MVSHTPYKGFEIDKKGNILQKQFMLIKGGGNSSTLIGPYRTIDELAEECYNLYMEFDLSKTIHSPEKAFYVHESPKGEVFLLESLGLREIVQFISVFSNSSTRNLTPLCLS